MMKRIACFLLALAMLAGTVCMLRPATAYAETTAEKLEKAKEKVAELQAELDAVRANKQEVLDQKYVLDKRNTALMEEAVSPRFCEFSTASVRMKWIAAMNVTVDRISVISENVIVVMMIFRATELRLPLSPSCVSLPPVFSPSAEGIVPSPLVIAEVMVGTAVDLMAARFCSSPIPIIERSALESPALAMLIFGMIAFILS